MSPPMCVHGRNGALRYLMHMRYTLMRLPYQWTAPSTKESSVVLTQREHGNGRRLAHAHKWEGTLQPGVRARCQSCPIRM